MAPIEAGRLLVEDGLPGVAEVGGLPHPAVDRTDVKDIRLAGHAGDGAGATSAKGILTLRQRNSPSSLVSTCCERAKGANEKTVDKSRKSRAREFCIIK